MLPRSVKLFLVKPATNMVTIKLLKQIEVEVSIEAKNIDACKVSIDFDSKFLGLSKGNKLASLTSGSFIKRLTWSLQAKKISSSDLWIEVVAKSEKIYQIVGFNLAVIN